MNQRFRKVRCFYIRLLFKHFLVQRYVKIFMAVNENGGIIRAFVQIDTYPTLRGIAIFFPVLSYPL